MAKISGGGWTAILCQAPPGVPQVDMYKIQKLNSELGYKFLFLFFSGTASTFSPWGRSRYLDPTDIYYRDPTDTYYRPYPYYYFR